MTDKLALISPNEIENQIFTLRNVQIMIDSHLAEMYGIETKVLNQAVKRNIDRFPPSFRFQLTEDEFAHCARLQNMTLNDHVNLRSQFVTSSLHGGRRFLPYAFTEQGVAMLSAVLRSETAVQVSIQIMNAFVGMRKLLINNAGLLQRIESVENKLTLNDANFERIFTALESNNITPKQDIFFNGQIYEAYSFVIKLIEKAQKSIVLIDNYVDINVLDMLAKKQNKVAITIVTQPSTPLKPIDISKFNQQYPTILLNHTKDFHDRFLVIDNQELYHIGASLKDLGKKCFAFSLIEEKQLLLNLLNKL